MYNGPIRGGSRGGRDQFNWESVKSNKDREFYLGHSVKASVGRWQKGKDILWYTRAKLKNGNALNDERKAVRNKEEDLMLEALGLKKKNREEAGAFQASKLERYELDEMLRRGTGEEGSGAGAGLGMDTDNGETVKGLGFKPGNFGGVAVKEVLAGVNDLKDANFSMKPSHCGHHPESLGNPGIVNYDMKPGSMVVKEPKKRKKEKRSKKIKEKERKTKRKKVADFCLPQENALEKEQQANNPSFGTAGRDDRVEKKDAHHTARESISLKDGVFKQSHQEKPSRDKTLGRSNRNNSSSSRHDEKKPVAYWEHDKASHRHSRYSDSSNDSWEKLDKRHRKKR